LLAGNWSLSTGKIILTFRLNNLPDYRLLSQGGSYIKMSNPPVKISRNKIARLENSFNYHIIDWGKGVFDTGEKITEE